MAYRSPELYDIQKGTELDEKVDIWVRIQNNNYKNKLIVFIFLFCGVELS